MSLKQLPVWRDANRFLLAIEQAVRHFPRYHKYTLGSELRKNALLICNLIQRAWQQKERQCELLRALQHCIDEVKIQLHLAKKLGAFRQFSQFEYLARQLVALGKQNGGWYKARCKAGAGISGL